MAGQTTLDALVSDGNPFPFFAAVDESGWESTAARTTIRRLRFDLCGEGRTWSEEIVFLDAPGVLGRIDDRFASLPYHYAFMACGLVALDIRSPGDAVPLEVSMPR
ncbi:MAG TPA: hypothetical protein VNS79_06125 [Sphingobium sp.]|nr:hypothetical protein [Sphingobium sp.]